MTSLFQPCKVLKSSLNNIPIEEGQCIFCLDTQEIYVDSDNQRILVSRSGYDIDAIDTMMAAL